MQKSLLAACVCCGLMNSNGLLADKVQLHNGSVIMGSVTNITDDKLQIDSGYGQLSIPLKDISTLETDNPLWIRLKGEQAFSPWKVETRNNQLHIVSPDQSQVRQIDPADFASVSWQSPDSDEWRWSGNANAYLNLQRGNIKKDTFNADGRFAVRDRLNRNTLDWKTEYEEDDQAKLKDRWQVKYGYNRFLSPAGIWQAMPVGKKTRSNHWIAVPQWVLA